jgi:hypothetical protein
MRLERTLSVHSERHTTSRDVHNGLVVLATLHLRQSKQICGNKSSVEGIGDGVRRCSPLMTVTRNRFSVSSFIAPEMDPMAQQSVLRLPHDHSDPSTCFDNFSVTANNPRQSHVKSEEVVGLTDGLRVDDVEMSEVDENLPHALVEDDGVNLLQELSHDLSLIVLNNQDLQFESISEYSRNEREKDSLLQASPFARP